MMEVSKAILELEGEREKLTLAIDVLKKLNSFADANLAPATAVASARKRTLPASARAEMRAAQKRRWAKWRKQNGVKK